MILTTVTDDDSITSAPSWSSPVITIVPANLTAELGANVTLKCAAEGDPKPKIRYSLCNGSALRMHSRYKY